MEGNRDEAEKCVEIAREALNAGDRERAQRFLHKAQKLYPLPAARGEALGSPPAPHSPRRPGVAARSLAACGAGAGPEAARPLSSASAGCRAGFAPGAGSRGPSRPLPAEAGPAPGAGERGRAAGAGSGRSAAPG